MRFQLLALSLLTMAVASPTFAGDNKHGGGKQGGHRGVFCPHCGEACYPTVTKGKEKKHYFEVEAKTICIPKVRFPWQAAAKVGGKDSCPTPNCGHTKLVNVLVKHEYECSVCEYSWDPDYFKNGNGKGSDKYKSAPTPAANGPEVAPPPPVTPEAPAEARQQLRQAAPLPVRFDPPPTDATTTAPRKKTYAEILTGFFK